jgi:hypothetical protein
MQACTPVCAVQYHCLYRHLYPPLRSSCPTLCILPLLNQRPITAERRRRLLAQTRSPIVLTISPTAVAGICKTCGDPWQIFAWSLLAPSYSFASLHLLKPVPALMSSGLDNNYTLYLARPNFRLEPDRMSGSAHNGWPAGKIGESTMARWIWHGLKKGYDP